MRPHKKHSLNDVLSTHTKPLTLFATECALIAWAVGYYAVFNNPLVFVIPAIGLALWVWALVLVLRD